MGPNLNGKPCRIVSTPERGGFALYCGDELIERGPVARRLSEMALNAGALEVRWDFDLKLAEWPR